jgi:hypothetical protein
MARLSWRAELRHWIKPENLQPLGINLGFASSSMRIPVLDGRNGSCVVKMSSAWRLVGALVGEFREQSPGKFNLTGPSSRRSRVIPFIQGFSELRAVSNHFVTLSVKHSSLKPMR